MGENDAPSISVNYSAPPFSLLLGRFLHLCFYWPVDLFPLNRQDQIARLIYLRRCKSPARENKGPVCAVFRGKQRKVSVWVTWSLELVQGCASTENLPTDRWGNLGFVSKLS